MPIANYTTGVPSDRSLSQIEAMLLGAGARTVGRHFNASRRVVGVDFSLETEFGERAFRLPVRVEGVHKALIADPEVSRGKSSSPEQAERVAWRIAHDWLRSQLALIEAGMASLPEVMFPYTLVNGQDTVYEAYQQKQLER